MKLAVTMKLAAAIGEIAHGMRAIVGVPDYELYVLHMAEHHPDLVPMSAERFESESYERRFSKAGSRCC